MFLRKLTTQNVIHIFKKLKIYMQPKVCFKLIVHKILFIGDILYINIGVSNKHVSHIFRKRLSLSGHHFIL